MNCWDNAVLHERYRSVAVKRESSTAKASVFESVFVPILTCDLESWVLTEIISQVQVAESDFAMSPWCDTSRRSAQLWNSQSPECGITSPRNWEGADINISVSVMFREVAYKRLAGKSSWIHPRKSGSEVIQGLGLVNTCPTLLDLVLVWSQQNYLKLLLTVRYSTSS